MYSNRHGESPEWNWKNEDPDDGARGHDDDRSDWNSGAGRGMGSLNNPPGLGRGRGSSIVASTSTFPDSDFASSGPSHSNGQESWNIDSATSIIKEIKLQAPRLRSILRYILENRQEESEAETVEKITTILVGVVDDVRADVNFDVGTLGALRDSAHDIVRTYQDVVISDAQPAHGSHNRSPPPKSHDMETDFGYVPPDVPLPTSIFDYTPDNGNRNNQSQVHNSDRVRREMSQNTSRNPIIQQNQRPSHYQTHPSHSHQSSENYLPHERPSSRFQEQGLGPSSRSQEQGRQVFANSSEQQMGQGRRLLPNSNQIPNTPVSVHRQYSRQPTTSNFQISPASNGSGPDYPERFSQPTHTFPIPHLDPTLRHLRHSSQDYNKSQHMRSPQSSPPQSHLSPNMSPGSSDSRSPLQMSTDVLGSSPPQQLSSSTRVLPPGLKIKPSTAVRQIPGQQLPSSSKSNSLRMARTSLLKNLSVEEQLAQVKQAAKNQFSNRGRGSGPRFPGPGRGGSNSTRGWSNAVTRAKSLSNPATPLTRAAPSTSTHSFKLNKPRSQNPVSVSEPKKSGANVSVPEVERPYASNQIPAVPSTRGSRVGQAITCDPALTDKVNILSRVKVGLDSRKQKPLSLREQMSKKYELPPIALGPAEKKNRLNASNKTDEPVPKTTSPENIVNSSKTQSTRKGVQKSRAKHGTSIEYEVNELEEEENSESESNTVFMKSSKKKKSNKSRLLKRSHSHPVTFQGMESSSNSEDSEWTNSELQKNKRSSRGRRISGGPSTHSGQVYIQSKPLCRRRASSGTLISNYAQAQHQPKSTRQRKLTGSGSSSHSGQSINGKKQKFNKKGKKQQQNSFSSVRKRKRMITGDTSENEEATLEDNEVSLSHNAQQFLTDGLYSSSTSLGHSESNSSNRNQFGTIRKDNRVTFSESSTLPMKKAKKRKCQENSVEREISPIVAPFTPSKVIGPNDVIVNTGLIKIKLESDYIPPVVVKQESVESSEKQDNDEKETVLSDVEMSISSVESGEINDSDRTPSDDKISPVTESVMIKKPSGSEDSLIIDKLQTTVYESLGTEAIDSPEMEFHPETINDEMKTKNLSAVLIKREDDKLFFIESVETVLDVNVQSAGNVEEDLLMEDLSNCSNIEVTDMDLDDVSLTSTPEDIKPSVEDMNKKQCSEIRNKSPSCENPNKIVKQEQEGNHHPNHSEPDQSGNLVDESAINENIRKDKVSTETSNQEYLQPLEDLELETASSISSEENEDITEMDVEIDPSEIEYVETMEDIERAVALGLSQETKTEEIPTPHAEDSIYKVENKEESLRSISEQPILRPEEDNLDEEDSLIYHSHGRTQSSQDSNDSEYSVDTERTKYDFESIPELELIEAAGYGYADDENNEILMMMMNEFPEELWHVVRWNVNVYLHVEEEEMYTPDWVLEIVKESPNKPVQSEQKFGNIESDGNVLGDSGDAGDDGDDGDDGDAGDDGDIGDRENVDLLSAQSDTVKASDCLSIKSEIGCTEGSDDIEIITLSD